MHPALTWGALLGAGGAAGLSGGTAGSGGQYGFLAKVTHPGAACSGALVDRFWVITAASCFPATPQGGVPASAVKVTLGDVDLGRGTGTTADVVELVRRGDRDVMLARLAAPVVDVAPVPLGTAAPVAGQALQAGGFGRTATEWVPDKPRIAAFSVSSVDPLRIASTGADGVDTCKGDAGGPALRTSGGAVELVGVNTTSWQHGCLAVTESRQGSTHVRTDDIAAWVRDTAATTAVAEPAPVSFGEDVHVFAVGADRQLHQKVLHRGQGWTAWAPLGGNLAGPVAVHVRGQELHLGGVVSDSPTVTTYAGSLQIYARGEPSGHVFQKAYDPNRGWLAWSDVGADVAGGPAITVNADASLHVYARDSSNGHVTLRPYVFGQDWQPWSDLGAMHGVVLR